MMLVSASGCVFPQRHSLPEIRGQLLRGPDPVTQAMVGYSWDWGEEACGQSLKAIVTESNGSFVLGSASTWGIGVITGVPDYGRGGWQLCFELPNGERRYFTTWWGRARVATVRCDLERPKTVDVCKLLPPR